MGLSTACRSASRHEPGEVTLQAPITSTVLLDDPPQPTESQTDTTNDDTDRLLKMVSLGTSSKSPMPAAEWVDASRPSIRHAGVAPDKFRDLTEDELLVLAINHSEVIRSLGVRVLNSPQSITTRFDPAIRASDPFFGPAAALAEFDSQVSASLLSQNNDRVFNNATLGGDVQELVQDFAELNTAWQKRNTFGTQFDIRSIQTYDSNNRAGNRFPSFWETQLELGIRQPLLRGAGREFNLIAGPNARPGLNFSNGIWIARINTRISQADFQIALRDYLMDLYTAYWDLRQQYAVYENVIEARDVAYGIWKTVESKKLSGLIGGEAYKEAQSRATYFRFQRDVESALGGGNGSSGLYVSERNLRRLIGLPPTDRELLRPVDPPASARFEFDLTTSVATAITHRTELCRQRLELQQKNLRLIAAKNFLLPQLDLIGRHRIRGFGDDLGGGGDRFASAADDFYSAEHQEWQFGVETSVSPPRRQARAAVRNAALEIQRERAILLEQERGVAYEVEDAVAEIQSAYLMLQSSRQQVTASQHRLESSQTLYDAGKLQLEFLLDATEQLVRARTQLAIDQSRYSLSLVRLSRTKGTLLSDVGINPCHQ